MAEWHTDVATRAGASTVISDVYRAMQSRLDGYRQSAGAVIVGILAASLAIDSGLARSLLSQNFVEDFRDHPVYLYFVVGGAAVLVEGICIVGLIMIRSIGKYFAEMTSVVHKIDEANNMWKLDCWFNGETFYPNKFKADDTTNVTRDASTDAFLKGWFDPTIGWYRKCAWALIFLQLAFFAAPIAWSLCELNGLGW